MIKKFKKKKSVIKYIFICLLAIEIMTELQDEGQKAIIFLLVRIGY